VNPDVTNFITTGEVVTIGAHSDASNRINHVMQVDTTLLISDSRRAIFTSF